MTAERTRRRTPDSRARRAREQQARRVRIGLMVLGSLLVAGSIGTWVAALISDPARLPLKTIRITGELAHVDRAQLQQRVAEAIDGGFFAVDMVKVRDAAEQLAWVDRVSIRRVWPQTLIMDVSEQVPVARWGKDALVNARGEIFRPDGSALPGGLPSLDGKAETARQVVDFFTMAQQRLGAIGLKVQALDLRGHYDWRLTLDNGMTLLLRQQDAEQSLQSFIAALPVMTDKDGRRPEQIDMRYENGFAVRWAPPAKADDKETVRGDA